MACGYLSSDQSVGQMEVSFAMLELTRNAGRFLIVPHGFFFLSLQ